MKFSLLINMKMPTIAGIFTSPEQRSGRPIVLPPALALVSTNVKVFVKVFKTSLLSHLLVAGCDIGVRFSVRPSLRLSTFMSTFDIYVKVSILINYKTKQPSNLAWNISLTSWLCNIGVRFSVCLSIRPSICQHLCRSSTFMSKLVF